MIIENCRDIARDLGRIYHAMSTTGLDDLSAILIPVKFAKGDTVLHEGDVCKYLYYIDKGLLRQYYYKNNKDVTEHISFEGHIVFCIESFLLQTPSRLMVETLEPTLAYLIPYDKLEDLTEKSREIEVFYRKVLEHALISSQIHADSQRFESAQERYKRLLAAQPEIFLRAPLVHIASYLQMTPETLSRVRAAQMQEELLAAKAELKTDKPLLYEIQTATSVRKEESITPTAPNPAEYTKNTSEGPMSKKPAETEKKP
jgi:CRP-like cAMP-binding protein